MTEIARIFDNSKNAAEAASELRANNFANVRVAAANGKPGQDAVDAIVGAGFPAREAELYAGSLKNGGAVLYVELPFGRGRLAEKILDRHGPSTPVPSDSNGVSSERSRRAAANGEEEDARAAPFSTLLRLPVLTDPHPTTVSSLGDQRPTFPTALLRSDFLISRLFGLPLLTESKTSASLINDPTPLSSWLGLPVLLKSRRRPREINDPPTGLDTSESGDGRSAA